MPTKSRANGKWSTRGAFFRLPVRGQAAELYLQISTGRLTGYLENILSSKLVVGIGTCGNKVNFMFLK
jgi:hypothetical protein